MAGFRGVAEGFEASILPSMRPLRSDDVLQEAARHVVYEIHMLVYASKGLGGYHASPRTVHEDDKNIQLESFLLHFRNLHAFLCPKLHRPLHLDDVIASDFLKKDEAQDVGDLSRFTFDEQKRLNRMLAHISYDRATYADSKPGWPVAEMLVLMLEQLNVFFATIPGSSHSKKSGSII